MNLETRAERDGRGGARLQEGAVEGGLIPHAGRVRGVQEPERVEERPRSAEPDDFGSAVE